MRPRATIYRAVIIGAGRIGCGFDSPRSRDILTHAHAIIQNRHLKLTALVDTNAARGKREAERWDAKFYSNLGEMFEREHPDIVVIATPDQTHTRMLFEAARRKPRLIICEKPITLTVRQAKSVRKYRVPIVVNLSRRFDASMLELRAALLSGRFGRVLSASGIYTKGTFHNGSHMIDLARFLFGEMEASTAHFKRSDWEGKASIGGVAVFERCPEFHLMLADARAYAIFEVDILTEKKRIRITDEGRTMLFQRVIADPLYKGFRILSAERKKKTRLDKALPKLYEHAVNVLDGKEKSHSTLSDALKTHDACMQFAAGIK